MTTTTCPHCGKPVPASAPGGLCPDCMLKVGVSATGEAEPGETIPLRAPSDPPTPEEIAALFPQLEILDCLGRGGMGAVYKARQPKLDRMVALKILLPDTGTNLPDPGFSERFAREARALAQLNHPNIVAVYDFGEAGGYLYLLMEYVDGLNLRQMIRAERMKPDVALAIVPPICEALQYAHEQGIIHRDIKPENILVDPAGRVKIADFGIAKILRQRPGEDALTREHHVMGTPHYMAPEQVEHPLTVDHRADIYSLGVVFYEMLTGELPLGRFAPPSRKVKVDVRLDEVVLHALEKEPGRRYQHVSEVKTDLDGISRGPATPAAAAPLDRRRRLLLGYGFICCLIGLPAGLALDLPYVTMLSVIGVFVIALKLSGRWPFPSLFTGEPATPNLPPVPPGEELTPGQMALLYIGFTCCIFGLGAASLHNFPPLFRVFLGLLSLIGLGILIPAIVLRRRLFVSPPAGRAEAQTPVRPRRGPLYWVITLLLGGLGLLILISVVSIAISIGLPAIQRARIQAAAAANEAAAASTGISRSVRAFGPVREVTLAGEGDEQQRFFDLDRQQSFASTNFFALGSEPSPTESAAVRQKHGIDLAADTGIDRGALVGFDMVVIPVHVQEWGMPPSRLAHYLKPSSSPKPNFILPANLEHPATFVFRTGDGGEGVLQIVGVDPHADPPAVSLRYKLAETN